ncbi:MAG: hypothetical protein DSY77_13445 [Bacteroidetes bacterium]|nr:MAG: hypothetical protein DSY77_13445 [Bacteroidota bacterium]
MIEKKEKKVNQKSWDDVFDLTGDFEFPATDLVFNGHLTDYEEKRYLYNQSAEVIEAVEKTADIILNEFSIGEFIDLFLEAKICFVNVRKWFGKRFYNPNKLHYSDWYGYLFGLLNFELCLKWSAVYNSQDYYEDDEVITLLEESFYNYKKCKRKGKISNILDS